MTEKKKEYFRVYMLNRYHIRRKLAIEFLGGKCIKCGTTENLELDHIKKETKSFEIAKLWNKPIKYFWKEIEKCQLLCKFHHEEKSLEESGMKRAKGTHGNLSSYRYCGPIKCELCKKVKREYTREYRKDKKLENKDYRKKGS